MQAPERTNLFNEFEKLSMDGQDAKVTRAISGDTQPVEVTPLRASMPFTDADGTLKDSTCPFKSPSASDAGSAGAGIILPVGRKFNRLNLAQKRRLERCFVKDKRTHTYKVPDSVVKDWFEGGPEKQDRLVQIFLDAGSDSVTCVCFCSYSIYVLLGACKHHCKYLPDSLPVLVKFETPTPAQTTIDSHCMVYYIYIVALYIIPHACMLLADMKFQRAFTQSQEGFKRTVTVHYMQTSRVKVKAVGKFMTQEQMEAEGMTEKRPYH